MLDIAAGYVKVQHNFSRCHGNKIKKVKVVEF